jgi:hypothetical protein
MPDRAARHPTAAPSRAGHHGPTRRKSRICKEALAKTKSEIGEINLLRIVIEREASLVRHTVILAVNMKPVQMGIASAHRDLNGVVEIGNAVITAELQATPDHRTDATQPDPELYTQISCGPGIGMYCMLSRG